MGSDILNKFNGECEQSYKEIGLCHSYFFENFNVYPSVLSIKHKDYLEHIKTFHDPILTYVALYLHNNYEIAQQYFKPNGNKNFINKSYGKDYNTACAVLNRWLDQQKNFYTDFGKCYYNKRWWNYSIEPLWKMLEGYYSGKICERYSSYYDKKVATQYHNSKDRCYQQQPEDYVCYKDDTDSSTGNEDNKYIEENCTKLSVLFYLGEIHSLFNESSGDQQNLVNKYCSTTGNTGIINNNSVLKNGEINYNPVLKAEKLYFCESLISTIALPISVTVLGTIFLAFFLSEFTPLGSIFRNSSKNKIKLREQFKEEAAYKQHRTHRNDNKNTSSKNIIYYQSMNE